jgi:hypothetical protein
LIRIVEHRSALPNGAVVELRVSHDAASNTPVLATIALTKFGADLDPSAFPQPLPVADAFLAALAYAELAGVTCVLIDDPGLHFPPEKRPVRDVSAP